MSLVTMVKQLHSLQVGKPGGATRQIVLPVAASVTLTANGAGLTYGVWNNIALLGTVLADSLLVGVITSAPSAVDEYTIDLGSTLVNGVAYANAAAVIAAGGAVVAAAHRQEVRTWAYIDGAGGGAATDYIGINQQGFIPLYSPIFIPAGTGVIGRCYGVTAAAVTINVSILLVQGF